MKSVREARERDFLIVLMRQTKPRTLSAFKKTVKSSMVKIENQIKKIEKMPEDEFKQRVSQDIFGVASKGFYTSQLEKDVQTVENLGDRFEWLMSLRCGKKNDRLIYNYQEKSIFKGRMKEAKELLDQFAPKCKKVK